MNVIKQLSSLPLYVICGSVILFVAAFCVFFMVRAYRAGVALGMDQAKLKRTITSSATFTLLPSVSPRNPPTADPRKRKPPCSMIPEQGGIIFR